MFAPPRGRNVATAMPRHPDGVELVVAEENLLRSPQTRTGDARLQNDAKRGIPRP